MIYYMVIFWKVLGTGGMVVVPQPYNSFENCKLAIVEYTKSFEDADAYYIPRAFCVRGEKNA